MDQPFDQAESAALGLNSSEFGAARPVFERAIHIVEAMLSPTMSDVVMLVGGKVWRASLAEQAKDDSAPVAEWVRGGDSLVWIADARLDERWKDHPLVVGAPYLRFFVGAPIRLASGLGIGTLMAASTEPRAYDVRAARALLSLADFIADECQRILLRRDLAQARGEARSAREAIASFIEASPASVVMTDREFRVVRSSPAWRHDFKVEDKPLAGALIDDLLPGTSERWSDAWARTLRGDSQGADQVCLAAADGSTLWAQVKVSPWRGADGEIAGLIILSNNVTDVVNSLEQAKRSEQRLTLAASLAALHVWELDYRAKTLLKVGAHDSFFQTPVTYEQLAADPWGLVHSDDRERCKAAWARHVRLGEPYKVEHRTHRTDGREVWVFATSEYLEDDQGRPLRLVGAMKDITEHKRAEVAMAAARDAAESANRAKSEFLANMSHEIRTPLNGVMGVAGALARSPLSSEQREMVGLIETSAHSLEGLVSDVLDLARIESGRLELRAEPFDLAGCLRQVAALFASPARAKGLTFEAQIAPDAHAKVLGDVTRLRQIVSNLFSNAVKFTASGKVAMAVTASRDREALRFTVSISDTGIGFDGETRARLFQRFEQADGSITRRYGGTGLGLSISRSLAEAMGGDLDVVSAPGEGSTFSLALTLPLSVEGSQAADAEPATSPAEARGRRRVLLAEDHPTNRRVVQLILERIEVDLTCVEDGAQAVAAAAQQDFDLILMDTQMPVMDGLSAIRAIRRHEAVERARRTPIISLTANAMPEHAEASRSAGADGHLTKPIAADKLIAAVLAVDAQGLPAAMSA